MNKAFVISLIVLSIFSHTTTYGQDCIDDQDCLGFFFTDVQGSVGDTVCTDQYVCNFTNILSFQFAIQYDKQVLNFVECRSGELATYTCDGVIKPEEGILNTLWFEQNAKIVTLDAGTILSTLCFEIIGIPEDETAPLLQMSSNLEAEVTVGDPDDPTSAISSTNICSGGGPAMTSSCANSDSLTLVNLYNDTDGPRWLIQWTLTNPIESWYGVKSNERGEVTELDLQNNNLKGELPASLSGLCQLKKLNLSKNRLSGAYPAEFETLCNIEEVDFTDNELGSFETFCGDLTSATVDIAQSNILMYPNPVGNVLNIVFEDNTLISSLKMYDLSGRMVLYQNKLTQSNVIDLSEIQAGIYMINLATTNGDFYFSKIVKHQS